MKKTDLNATIKKKVKYSIIIGRNRGVYVVKNEEKILTNKQKKGKENWGKIVDDCIDEIEKKQINLYKPYFDYKIQVRKYYKRRLYSFIEYTEKKDMMLDLEFEKNNKEMVKIINKEFKNNNIKVKVFYLR